MLVTGENGAGKDNFYKILHNGSRRRHQKCIAVNCGGLPEGTIDSELFGHVKGAYTGAVGDRKGYFEEANGGTIFLDEVGDLPMSIQSKLLRVLEKGEIIRMGSNEVRQVDVRIVAATNVDLKKAIAQGKFREDLYYRLSTISIQVPSLRDRPEDISLLFRYFAGQTAQKYRMTQGIQLTPEAQQVLLGYTWPGNVRQLLHVVEEISIIEEARMIDAVTLRRHLPEFTSEVSAGGGGDTSSLRPGEREMIFAMIGQLRQELDEVRKHLNLAHAGQTFRTPRMLGNGTPTTGNPIVTPYHPNARQEEEFTEAELVEGSTTEPVAPQQPPKPLTLAEIERQAIVDALRRNAGNKRKVAEQLDIAERTIHRKIKDYDIKDEEIE